MRQEPAEAILFAWMGMLCFASGALVGAHYSSPAPPVFPRGCDPAPAGRTLSEPTRFVLISAPRSGDEPRAIAVEIVIASRRVAEETVRAIGGSTNAEIRTVIVAAVLVEAAKQLDEILPSTTRVTAALMARAAAAASEKGRL